MSRSRRNTRGRSSRKGKRLSERVNADKPHLWKTDIAASVDQFNRWFMRFAPQAFRETRVQTTKHVRAALLATDDLRSIDVVTLRTAPGTLPTLRMCTAPPLAVDRLVGLGAVNKSLVAAMERGRLPVRMKAETVDANLNEVCGVLMKLLDRDIFPWLDAAKKPTSRERDRASTIVADRLCGAIANPIVRNAQEQRQLTLIGRYLNKRGYRSKRPASGQPLTGMEPGTYAFRMNIAVGEARKVNIAVDVVIQPRRLRRDGLPILVEAKSAGDFTNTNKRRKEEATKIHQLQATHGESVSFILFLCGYFGSDYLGYEAAEGLDWVWEHRIDDFARLGL